MRVLIQRVSEASVWIDSRRTAHIGPGLLCFYCAEVGDHDDQVSKIARKVVNLRVFASDTKPMEKSLLDVGGEMLIVSQFTLAASTRKGNRPSFSNAEKPARAKCLYEQFVAAVKRLGIQVATGKFAADMDVALTNDGPVTLLLSDAG